MSTFAAADILAISGCKAEMSATVLCFNIAEGIDPVLQIADGWTADLPVPDRTGGIHRCVQRYGKLGCQ